MQSACEARCLTRSGPFGRHLHLYMATPKLTTPACAVAGAVLRQLATACGSYLPLAAKEAMLAAAKQLPAHGAALGDSADALEREMRENPLKAAAHEASEL